jgi:hypothetical protein
MGLLHLILKNHKLKIFFNISKKYYKRCYCIKLLEYKRVNLINLVE